MKGAHKRGFKSERQASAARRAVMGMVWHEELGWVAERTYERVVQVEGLVRRACGLETERPWEAEMEVTQEMEINAEAQRREGAEKET